MCVLLMRMLPVLASFIAVVDPGTQAVLGNVCGVLHITYERAPDSLTPPIYSIYSTSFSRVLQPGAWPRLAVM